MSASKAKSGMDGVVRKYEESPEETELRNSAGFPKLEEQLNLRRFSRLNLATVDRVTSLLGSKNPFSRKASASENEVWLFDTTGHKTSDAANGTSAWEVDLVACYFIKDRANVTKAVSYIADAIGLDGKVGEDDEVRKTIAQRLYPFVAPIAPARTIVVTIPRMTDAPLKFVLGPSNSNGISLGTISANKDDFSENIEVEYANDGSDYPATTGTIRFAGPEGWAVVSDIDDTIKITQTSNPVGILQTTFVEEPKTTEGMPEFYKILQEQFQSPVWFYVSASPYNLYPFLRQFIRDHYPPGTIELRDASWMYFGGLLQSLTQGVKEYKSEQISKINGWLPQRKTICIGDSTQMDPETYAAMYLKYPGWIKAIYIRKVVDAPFMEIKNKEERFVKAFKGVPEHIWKVFTKPNELAEHVKGIATEAHLDTVDSLQLW